jgi:putative ATP-binding cassette transporter
MNLLLFLFKQSPFKMALISIASLISGLAGAALVAIIGRAIASDDARITLAIAFFGLCLVYIFSKSISEIWLLRLTQKLVLDLRMNLSQSILHTSQLKLQRIGKDGLMMILTKDVDSFGMAFQVLPSTVSSIIVIATCLGYTAWLSPQIFIIFIITMLLCVGGYLLAEKKPLQQLLVARQRLEGLYSSFRGLVDGSRELKQSVHRRDHFINNVIGDEAVECSKLYSSCMSRYTWINNVGNILFYQSIAIVLFILPLFSGESLQTVVSATLVMLYVVRPISELMLHMPVLRQAGISLERIRNINKELDDPTLPTIAPDPFGGAFQSLFLNHIHFQYKNAYGESFNVGPIKLSFDSGTITFIQGGNGSGKTSLMMVLIGLYENLRGSIELNGIVLNEHNLAHYRQKFSVIFADGHLFRELPVVSSQENIEKANHYIDRLGLHGKVSINNNTFSTLDLSMGQKKRLMLVAALVEDRDVYVFDEWAADQDPEFKYIFYKEILPTLKSQGKTIIAITHDDRYFMCCDYLVKLDAGKLVEIKATSLDHHLDNNEMVLST